MAILSLNHNATSAEALVAFCYISKYVVTFVELRKNVVRSVYVSGSR